MGERAERSEATERTITIDEGSGSATPEREIPRGSSIGRYVILELLGQGGMGAVYSAYDPELERRVALKLLRTSLVGEGAAEWRARMMREAQAMARLSHPNVVTVYDVGVSKDGRVFLALEKVAGGTLSAWLKARERRWREIVEVLCAAGEGLAAAHEAGIVHRDFKPDNVLLGDDGRPRVTDFGLARAASSVPPSLTPSSPENAKELASVPADLSSGSLSRQLTLTGALLGTPGYMAPEQYGTDEPLDARADVFAFCATLYRALYGERPFAGKTVDEIASATLAGRVRPAPRGSDVPPWLRRVLLRGLSADREARHGSMRELLAALRADPAKRRRRWLAAAAIVAAVCSVVVASRVAGDRRVRACRAASGRLAGVWDAPRKAALASAFQGTRLGFADGARAKVEEVLDRYASSWAASAEDACLAARVRGEQSEAMLDLRTSCLDDRLDELRALGDVLTTADAKVVEKSVQAARSLSPIEPCSDIDRLGATSRLPDGAAARAEIRAVRSELAAAKALLDSGKFVESADRMNAVRERVEATHHGPLLVEWSMYMAKSKSQTSKKAMAEELRRTIALAETHRLDRVKAQAEILLGNTEGEQLAQYDAGHEWLQLASATIARLGGDTALEIERDVREGWIYQKESKLADAAPLFERALSRAAAAGVRLDETITLSNAHTGYACVLQAQGRMDEALEHQRAAVRLDEETYGADHPVVALDMNNLAYFELVAGQTQDALTSASRALAILEGRVRRGEIPANNARFATAAHTMGEILLRMRKPREALEQLARARGAYRATGAEHDAEALADNEIAEAHRLLGDTADAQRALDDARAVEAEVKGMAPATIAGTLVVQANILLDRKDADAALGMAEQGLAQMQAGDADPWSVAGARLTLARALGLGHADSARARALAEQARDVFVKLRDDSRAGDAAALLVALR